MSNKESQYKGIVWKNVPENIDEYIGFLYEIKEISSGMKYFGIKKYWKTNKTKPPKFKMKDGKHIKDKKGKRIVSTRKLKIHKKVSSDWENYIGSSKIVQELIKTNPLNYKKTILQSYNTVTGLKMAEVRILQNYYYVGNWNKIFNEEVCIRLRIRKGN